MQKNFTVNASDTNEVLGQAMAFIHDGLAALKLNTRDINHAELTCEEALISLLEHAAFSGKDSVRVHVSNFLGNVSINLTVPGKEFSFSGGIGEAFPLMMIPQRQPKQYIISCCELSASSSSTGTPGGSTLSRYVQCVRAFRGCM